MATFHHNTYYIMYRSAFNRAQGLMDCYSSTKSAKRLSNIRTTLYLDNRCNTCQASQSMSITSRTEVSSTVLGFNISNKNQYWFFKLLSFSEQFPPLNSFPPPLNSFHSNNSIVANIHLAEVRQLILNKIYASLCAQDSYWWWVLSKR